MAKVNLQMDQNSKLNTAILVTIQWKISLGEHFCQCHSTSQNNEEITSKGTSSSKAFALNGNHFNTLTSTSQPKLIITTSGYHLGKGLCAILHSIQCNVFHQGVQLATNK